MSAQASAAVTPDVALKGDAAYFRVGLFSRNFNKNVGDVGRLGNENDTYLEFGPLLTLAEVDGVEYRLISSFAMQSQNYKGGWADTNNQRGDRASRNMEKAGTSNNNDLGDYHNLDFAMQQAYVRVTGLLDSDKDAAIWVGKRYQRQDSYITDNKYRDVSGDSVGIENLSVGSGKFRATWVRRDGEAVFTNKYDGYTALGWTAKDGDLRPSKITNNIFDTSYRFSVGAESFLDLGYTFIAPQRYASEYSNYGYKLKDEIGNSHIVLARLDTKLFNSVNNTTVLRYVRGSTAEGGFGAHTYGVNSQDDSSYNIDLINHGYAQLSDRIGMHYHTWFNFARTTNNIGDNDSRSISRAFQLVVRPHYKLTKMTRLLLEAGMSTKSTASDNYVEDKNSFSNSQAQKLTLAYAITPDACAPFATPELRFFVTYKHYNDSHVGTYGNGFKVHDVANNKDVQLYEGRKTETFFGAQVEAMF